MKILYQSPTCIILNKPTRVHSDQSVAHCINSGAAEALRDVSKEAFSTWLPAHRIDFETSGCLLVCPPEHHERYLHVFKDTDNESTHKIYLVGASREIYEVPESGLLMEGWIVSRYRGSKSVTYFENNRPELAKKWHSKRAVRHHVSRGDGEAEAAAKALDYTGIPYLLRLHSGARHQIRAALKALGAPLINDPLYGWEGETPAEGKALELHAWKLMLKDPLNQAPVSATASERFFG